MARAIIDNRVRLEDMEQLKALHEKTSPKAPVPDFGAPNTETMVMRDEDDPQHIVGFIHVEHALEVRAIVTDPNYELRAQALSHAVTAMETRIRCGDFGTHNRFYVSVPIAHAHVRRHYEGTGAVIVDGDAVRFMKRLGD